MWYSLFCKSNQSNFTFAKNLDSSMCFVCISQLTDTYNICVDPDIFIQPSYHFYFSISSLAKGLNCVLHTTVHHTICIELAELQKKRERRSLNHNNLLKSQRVLPEKKRYFSIKILWKSKCMRIEIRIQLQKFFHPILSCRLGPL